MSEEHRAPIILSESALKVILEQVLDHAADRTEMIANRSNEAMHGMTAKFVDFAARVETMARLFEGNGKNPLILRLYAIESYMAEQKERDRDASEARKRATLALWVVFIGGAINTVLFALKALSGG